MGPLVRRQLAPAVDIDYVDPLPKRFDLVLRARAYGNNVGEPISVRVGDEERFVSLGEQDSTVTLRFDNPRGAQKISITPPAPTEPKESASGGFTPKKLGIGLGVAEGRSGRPRLLIPLHGRGIFFAAPVISAKLLRPSSANL